MHQPTYRQAMINAWQLVWHHRILWIFGLLSVFVGQLGLGDFFGQIITFGKQVFESNGQMTLGVIVTQAQSLSAFDYMNLFCVGIAAISILLLVAFVSVTAEGALIAVAVDWYKKGKIDSTAKAWNKGVQHFWKVLGVNVVQKLLLGALLLIVLFVWSLLVPTYSYDAGQYFVREIVVLTLAVAMFFAFMVSSVCIYALGYVMSEDAEVFDALSKGWKLFSNHILVSIELGLLLVATGFIVLMVLALGSFVALLLPLIFWLFGIMFGAIWLMKVGTGLALALLTLLVVLVAAIYNAFSTCAWIYLYMHMHHRGIVSRFGGWVHGLFSRKNK